MRPTEDKSPNQVVKAEGGSTIQNVIQTVIHMPAWAWLSSIAVLSVCICGAVLSAAAIFNINPLRQLLPTPIPFIPETGGRSLIIVADFDDRSGGQYTGIDPAQYIYEQLVLQNTKDKLDLRIERLGQRLDDNTAKAVGKTFNATLVVWGWYDKLTITPRLTRIKELKGIISDQEDLRLSLADPNKIEFSVITDLPSQTNYLILFTLGIDKFSSGRFDEAMRYFNNALQVVSLNAHVSTNPNEAYFYRGYIYSSNKNYDAAIHDYDQAITLNPGLVDAYNNRGIAHQQKGEYLLARDDYSKAIELNPDYAIPYTNRGALFVIYNEDYANAIVDLNKAIGLDPNFMSAYLGRAYAYMGMADFESATADFKKVLELSQESDHLFRAHAFSGIGDYDNALLESNKAIELYPDDINAYIVRGSVYSDTRQYKLAIQDFEKAIQLDQSYPFSGYLNLGNTYANKGDFDLAIQAYKEAIKYNPSFPDVYLGLGYAYTGKGEFGNAIDNYEIAISMNPDHAFFAYNNAGFLSTLTLDLEKAIPYLEKAKSITPNPLILLNLGDAYTLSGDLNKALDYQKDALQILETEGIEKDKAIQGVWLYNYLPLQKNDTATIQKYVRVPDLDGKKAFAYFDLSYSYALLGDFALADREFTAARQLDPERSYSNFFAYKIHSIENLLTADEDAWQWFTTHREILEGK